MTAKPGKCVVMLLTYLALLSCCLVVVTQSTTEGTTPQNCSPDNLDLCAAGEMPQWEESIEVAAIEESEEGIKYDEEELSYDPANEDERRMAYAARNYTWPPKIVPDTVGWNKLIMRRFRQLQFVEDSGDRWHGYLNLVTRT